MSKVIVTMSFICHSLSLILSIPQVLATNNFIRATTIVGQLPLTTVTTTTTKAIQYLAQQQYCGVNRMMTVIVQAILIVLLLEKWILLNNKQQQWWSAIGHLTTNYIKTTTAVAQGIAAATAACLIQMEIQTMLDHPICYSTLLMISGLLLVLFITEKPKYIPKSKRWNKRSAYRYGSIISAGTKMLTSIMTVCKKMIPTGIMQQQWIATATKRQPIPATKKGISLEVHPAFLWLQKENQREIQQEQQCATKSRRTTRCNQFFILLMMMSQILLSTVQAQNQQQSFADLEFQETLQIMTTMATFFKSLSASTKNNNPTQDHRYDSDSYIIAIDNCSSRSITNNMKDYIHPPQKVTTGVIGIGGPSAFTYKGTVKWTIEDNNGMKHSMIIPDTYYHKDCPYRLLSPQHWSQQRNEGRNSWCKTYHDATVLGWKGGAYQRSIPLDKSSNIAKLRSAPAFDRLHEFHALLSERGTEAITGNDPLQEAELFCMPVMIEDDEESIPHGNNAPPQEEEEEFPMASNQLHPGLPVEAFDTKQSADQQQTDPTTNNNPRATGWDDITKSEVHIIPEDEAVQQLSPQAQLLAWHYRLGHLPFKRILHLAARGDLPGTLLKARVPTCASCMYGKATRRPWRTKAPVNQLSSPAATQPGSVVAVDQLISSTPGLIGQMMGFITKKRFTVTTVFVDHFSGLSYVHNQLSTGAAETIEAKKAFERYSKAHGVTVHHYHADNGIFATKAFMDEVQQRGQTITFCAVNAHHQNGRAEKKIRDLQESARTMLAHAKQRWPEAIEANLWPFAIRYANDIANEVPVLKGGSVSPIELFSQVPVAPKVKHAHTFGAPVYVLDSRLQSGKPMEKWMGRSRVGIYLGTSPRHSRKVALILSMTTGHVSPQFHYKVDDLFETMRPSAGNARVKSQWQQATHFCKPTVRRNHGTNKVDQQKDKSQMHHPANEATEDPLLDNIPSELEESPGDVPINNDDADQDQSHQQSTLLGHDPPAATTTRSGRVSRPPTRLIETFFVPWDVFHDDAMEFQELMEDPVSFAASSNPDIMYLNEAMSAPDCHEFRKAMHKEVEAHTNDGNWEIMKISDVPEHQPILPAVWAFRRKRRISTQEIYKWKARLNLHGGKQEHGVNYWETYAPVVGWSTINLFLINMILHKWESRQIDFVLAFPQADIECDIYMEIPQGFKVNHSRKEHCLKLRKNLYGQKQASRVWNSCLHDGMIARGFQQSTIDMCVYYRGNVSLLIYTDDGIFIGPTQAEIQECYDILTKEFTDCHGKKWKGFIMTDEGDLSDYLGVKIDNLPNGTIKLSQPQMIDAILKDLGFTAEGKNPTKSQSTPAATTVLLTRDINGSPMEEEWSYRSVIGKLNFLEKSTRPDLAYAVHQCARFSSDPKESHATAVKRIGRYLVGTRDKGLILYPQESQSFDTFVDANFVGDWDRVNAMDDPSTAKSRTGYILMYAGCPLVWASKIQREVALSTTEAEYNALSESLRQVIHTMQLMEEMQRKGWNINTDPPRVHCKVFEDNSGALEMARLPKMRPRTKHLCVRMHHFREHVRTGKVSIHKIPTEHQLADIATKPQPEALYVSQRESIMQWESEHQTAEQLLSPGKNLRACELISLHGLYLEEQGTRSAAGSVFRRGNGSLSEPRANGLMDRS